MYYILIFLCLGIGILIGYFRPPGVQANRWLHRGLLVTLIVMLAAMGAELGASPQILNQMGQIGGKAVILAFFATVGSVVAVYLGLERGLWNKKRMGKVEEEHQ